MPGNRIRSDDKAGFDPDVNTATLRVYTLGGFRAWRDNREIKASDWGRGKAIQLFQYLVTTRSRHLHKEQIIDQLWPDLDPASGDRDFKVALNAIYRALEPERKPRAQPKYILRNELLYRLNPQSVWVDADALEGAIASANRFLLDGPLKAVEYYREAVDLYAGDYLPERRYEDWTSAERERLELLTLGAMTKLAQLMVDQNPLESVHLTQQVLAIDRAWEDAYRVQMRAYMQLGNRPLALRTYQQCQKALMDLYGIDPLPETQQCLDEITRR